MRKLFASADLEERAAASSLQALAPDRWEWPLFVAHPGRLALFAGCLLWLLLRSASAGADALSPVVKLEDYERAERFLSWNKDRYVTNADIQHHWIGQQDRFWYLRTNVAGAKEFVVVDAATGERSPAFNHEQLAAALSQASGNQIEARRLPFETFHYTDDVSGIEFEYSGKLWTCDLKASRCSEKLQRHQAFEILSPDRRWAAFVQDHNVWVRSTEKDTAFALTHNGVEHHGYATSPGYSTHAVSDMRARKRRPPHLLWSPDSRSIFTYRLDERAVGEQTLTQAVPEDGSVRPKVYQFRYAVPGDEHAPTLEPVILDVSAQKVIRVATAPWACLPQSLIEKRDAWWAEDSRSVYYLKRDRYSRSVALQSASPETGLVKTLLEESSATTVQTNANNIFDVPLVRVLRNAEVIWYSQRDGWGHLYRYSRAGTLRNRITTGPWAVRGIVRVDENNGTVYFMASGREAGRDPYEQYLYSIRLDGAGLTLLTPEEGDHRAAPSLMNVAPSTSLSRDEETHHFSFSGRYFVDSYSRPDLPPVLLLRTAAGRLVRQLERADISKLQEGGYVPVESFKALAADGKTLIFGNMFRPSTFDPRKRYPIIDANYPGPQQIRTGKTFTAALFDIFEAQSLAELGFIVVTVDGRGTPNRDKAFLDYSYGRMERASELEDHIAAIRQLAQRYPYMDLDRVGIDGASGGGFMAARALLTQPHFYKVAVAAEGNHDQRGYMAAWAETYIGPLQDSAYEAASNLPLASRLRGKLFLVHGEMDDNVPPSLTMKLVDALIRENKDFDLLILPNQNHAAFFTSPYFIRRKWDYFVRHLLHADPPADYRIARP